MSFEPNIASMLLALIGALFGVICVLLGWIGTTMSHRLDALQEMISGMTAELHDRITGIDKRLVVVETKCGFEHGNG